MKVPDRYKVTLAGVIPEDWICEKIGKYIDVINGFAFNSKDFSDNGIKVVKISNITETGLDFTESSFITESQTKNYESFLASIGETVIAMTGATTGKVARISNKDLPCLVNQRVGRLRSLDLTKIHPEYVFFISKSSSFQGQIWDFAIGGAQPNISSSQIKDIVFPLPPLSEQQKIAEILSTVDEHIKETEDLIEKTKTLKQGTMQRLLTKGIGHTEFKETEIGRIPVDWKIVELDFVFKRVTSKNTLGNTNVMTISANMGLVNQLEYFNNSYASKDTSNYYLLKKGDFAYNKSYSNGYPMGVIKLLEKYDSGVVSPLYICMRIHLANATNDFFKYYFDSEKLTKALTPIAKEGARNHGLLNVTVPDFFSMPIALPTVEEQRDIASILTAIDKQIETSLSKLDGLNRLKSGLMQQLLTGRIRVKV